MKHIFKENKFLITLSIICAFVTSVFFLFEIFTIKYIISIADKKEFFSIKSIFYVFVIYFISYFLYYLKLRIWNKAGARNKEILNRLYFNSILNNNFKEFKSNKFEKKAATIISVNFNMINNYYFEEIYNLIYEITFVAVGTIYIAMYSIKIASITTIFYMLTFYFTKKFSSLNNKYTNEYSNCLAKLINKATDLIASSLHLYIYDKNKNYNNFIDEDKKVYSKNLKNMNLNKKIFSHTNELISILREVIVLFCIRFFVKDIDISNIFILVYLTTMISEPFKMLNGHIHSIKSTKLLRNEIAKILDTNIPKEGETIKEIHSLEVRNLTKSFNDNNIIKNLNLKFETGKKYLICCESGAGKSTLINIITKVIEPDSGNIFVNDNISFTEESLYGAYSLISQKETIINGSLLNNIILFEKDYNIDKYRKIKAQVRLELDDSIVLNVDNLKLSGGELQKILIARALYNNVNCIFLDEAYSALDRRSAIEIEKIILSNKSIMLINITHQIFEENTGKYDKIITNLHG